MNVRTYEANSMSEALSKVRHELGREAVILNTRTVKKGGLFGIGGKPTVEITATSGINVLHPSLKRSMDLGRPLGNAKDHRQQAGHRSPELPTKGTGGEARLEKELDLVKQMVRELVEENRRRAHPAVPEELFSTYLFLINQEVAKEIADDIVREVKSQLKPDQLSNEQVVRNAVGSCIEKMIPTVRPIVSGKPGSPRIIAFVGPTGVGKTTTIAKLAANFKLREGKSVGLVTIDTYRIAAVDQLRTYADIINVPLRVVVSPDELSEAIDSLRQFHVILIDTAGRSQNDQIRLHELKSFIDRADPDEVHLVLSATASQANIQANIRRFSALGIDRIVFTKLDEAVAVGMLLNVVRKLDQSISYVTTGQSVPDDIEPGSGRQLAKLLLDQHGIGSDGNADTPSTDVPLKYGT